MGTAELHYLPRSDRLLTAGERFQDLKEELAHDMRQALAGHQGWLTTTVTRQGSMSRAEALMSAPEAVAVAFEEDSVQDALRDVLDGSRCLLVASLRQRITAHLFRFLGESVLDALDNHMNAACLMQVLRSAHCAKVDALRAAIVSAYVEANAERVAEARSVR